MGGPEDGGQRTEVGGRGAEGRGQKAEVCGKSRKLGDRSCGGGGEATIQLARGGSLSLSKLALACPSCNLHKANRDMAVDPESGALVRLFHPCQQTWSDQFWLNGYRIEGLTPTGRAAIVALDFNHPRRQHIRAAEQRLGLYPPAV